MIKDHENLLQWYNNKLNKFYNNLKITLNNYHCHNYPHIP